MYVHYTVIDTLVSPANKGLKSSAAAARRRAFKTKQIFIEDNNYE